MGTTFGAMDSEGTGVADFADHWIGVNPAASAILGWSEGELLSMPISGFWHPDDFETTRAYRGQLIEGGRTVRFQNRYRHKDGTYRWLSWSSTAENGYIYAVGRDVTAGNIYQNRRRPQRAFGRFHQRCNVTFLCQITGDGRHLPAVFP